VWGIPLFNSKKRGFRGLFLLHSQVLHLSWWAVSYFRG